MPPMPTKRRRIPVILDTHLLATVEQLATAERRSVGNMLAVLVGEALAARESTNARRPTPAEVPHV